MEDKRRITVSISKEVLEKVKNDPIGKETFLSKNISPMIEQIIRKHYGFPCMFKNVKGGKEKWNKN